jgi:hypothetical protein
MFSFSGPGTYPLWYDPSYWYQGVDAHAPLLQQLKVAVRGLRDTVRLHQFAGLLALTILVWPFLRKMRRHWYLVAFGLAPIVGYCFILVDERFISGFAAIVAACLIACFSPFAAGYRRLALWLIAGSVSAAAVISPIRTIVPGRSHCDACLTYFTDTEQFALARRVSELAGLPPGAKIAIIGNPALHWGSDRFYSEDGRLWGASLTGSIQELWAWIARLRIVAELPPEDAHYFDEVSGDRKAQILGLFDSSGAEAIVSVNHPPFVIPGWKMTDCSGLLVYSRASAVGGKDRAAGALDN